MTYKIEVCTTTSALIERSASVSSTLHITSVHPVRQSRPGLSRSLQPGHQEILHYEEAEIMLPGLSHQYRLAPRSRDAGHECSAQSTLLSVTVMATPLGPLSLFVRLVSRTVHQLPHNPNPSLSNFRRWAVQVRATSRQRNCLTLRRACQSFGSCVDPNFGFLLVN